MAALERSGERERDKRGEASEKRETRAHLSEVEVDEVLGLVCDIGAEVPADDAVPCGVVFLVKLLLDEGGDVLLDVELLESLRFRGAMRVSGVARSLRVPGSQGVGRCRDEGR